MESRLVLVRNEQANTNLSHVITLLSLSFDCSENELKQFVETKILGDLRNRFATSSTGNDAIRQTSLDIFIWVSYRNFHVAYVLI